MLDTSVCIDLVRGHTRDTLVRLRQLPLHEVSVSVISVSELEYGVAKSSLPQRNAEALGVLLAPFTVEPFDDAAAAAYGEVRADLERRGVPIGGMDLLIAAHALSLGRTLVTRNAREFGRVRGLRVSDWG